MFIGLVVDKNGQVIPPQQCCAVRLRPFLLSLTLLTALPMMSVAQLNKVKIFQTKPGPPPGFAAAALKESQTNLIDVIYNGQSIAKVLADFNSQHIKFHQPALVLADIKSIKRRDELVKALTGEIATNERHLCSYTSPKPYCTALNPKKIGVILDQRRYRAYLFINPSFYHSKKQKKKSELRLPTAKSSVLLQNSIIASGTRDSHAYAWVNQTIWADQNNRASVDLSIQENNNINNGSGYSQMTIQRASYGRVNKGYLYQAGQLSTMGGSDFITQQYFLGLSARNFNTGLPEQNHYGTPISIYITAPSTIRVYRNGVLIATQQFNAGQHYLDTANFPVGAYDLSIQINQDATNQTRTITRYFVKQTALPPQDKLDFAIAGGVLQRNLSFNRSKFLNVPLYQSKPILFWRSIDALRYNLGWETAAVLNNRQLLLTQHVAYYGRYGNITPGALIGTRGIYGLSLGASTHFKLVNTGANFMKIWGRDKTNIVGFNNNEVFSSSNQPLTYNDMRGNLYASVNIGKGGDLYASSTYTQSGRGAIAKEYSLSYNQNIFSGQFNSLGASLSATRADQNTTYLASIDYEFNNASGWSAYARSGYSGTSNPSASAGHGDVLIDATLAKHTSFGVSRKLDVSGGVHRDATDRNANLEATYINNWFRSNASVTRSFARDNNNTSYSAEFDSNVVYAGGHFAMGYSQGYQSGIILDVLAPTQARIKVLVDGAPVAIVKTNTPTSVYLEPYMLHAISIVPLGDDLFEYNRSPYNVMLYRGNVQYLPWTLAKQYVLFTRVLDRHNNPISDALLKAKGAYNATDQLGYIQINATTKMKQLTFEKLGGKICHASIPKSIKVKDNFAQLDHLVCI